MQLLRKLVSIPSIPPFNEFDLRDAAIAILVDFLELLLQGD